jgi:hypothetical protein
VLDETSILYFGLCGVGMAGWSRIWGSLNKVFLVLTFLYTSYLLASVVFLFRPRKMIVLAGLLNNDIDR